MAPIPLKFLKSTKSVIFLLISILGFFVSCKKTDSGEDNSPLHATFIVKGEIGSTADSLPIPYMYVEIRNVKTTQSGQSESRLMDFDFSDAEGNYRLADIDTTLKNQTYEVRFTDADGTLNGQYETLDMMIVFDNPTFTNGDGKRNLGSVVRELNIKLKLKG